LKGSKHPNCRLFQTFQPCISVRSNHYLHEVLDTWFEDTVKPRLKGTAFLIRYADDAVLVFQEEKDARQVLDVLPKRFEKYGLTLHPEKTRLVAFQMPRPKGRADREDDRGTFDFLGFTHFWAVSRKGNWVIKRKTAGNRFTRALRAVANWCEKHRHLKLKDQWQALKRKLQGHFGYYGIIGNSKSLVTFRYRVRRTWQAWLNRRSNRARLNWEAFERLEKTYPLPAARIRPVSTHR
jgi:RNA-directed DNA polymerase